MLIAKNLPEDNSFSWALDFRNQASDMLMMRYQDQRKLLLAESPLGKRLVIATDEDKLVKELSTDGGAGS